MANAYFIDASMELWFGIEYDDPGDGVFPMGRDSGPQVPGKGNMILWDGVWVELTELNIELAYNWNLQAFVEMTSEPLFNLNLSANPEAGGSPSGGGHYKEGASVQISANTADGYNFINWTISDDIISVQEEITYTMPAYNVKITANFEEVVVPEYSLALIPNPDEGGNPSGDGSYEEGTDVLISAYPVDGFDFVNWTIGGEEISTNEDYYYSMPGQNITIVANYEETATSITTYGINDYDLTVFPNPNNGIFNVELVLSVETNIEIQIFDVLGRSVYDLPTQTLSNGKNSIKINQSSLLNRGFYILRINAYNINDKLLLFRKDMKILVE